MSPPMRWNNRQPFAPRRARVYKQRMNDEPQHPTTPPPRPMAVYVHWPFCKKKCPYCDFNSHVRDSIDHVLWRRLLLRELQYWREDTAGHTVTSIFFGGGTPSLMEPATVAAVIDEVHKHWPVATDIEITLEANPTSVEAEKFHEMRRAGINRVSLGVQSLKPESLHFLGREHSVREAIGAVSLAADMFPRYSFDLIYALPNQTVAQWEEELRAALHHARDHLSLYQLTIEPNTAFHHQYHVEKAFALPQEDNAADLYLATQRIMEEAGMPAYEISNHARPGAQSRHNLAYWRSWSYLGIGPGAHGRIHQGDNRIATHTRKSPERWLDQTMKLGHGLQETLMLNAQERLEEQVLMGLRLLHEGLDLAALSPQQRQHLLARAAPYISQNLLQHNTQHLRVTRQGALVLNALTAALLSS